MIDVNTALVIAAIVSPTITGALAFLTSLRNTGKIDHLHTEIDGRLTELIEAVRAKSHAEGMLEGRAKEKSEHEKT